jgi:hypothetical protein
MNWEGCGPTSLRIPKQDGHTLGYVEGFYSTPSPSTRMLSWLLKIDVSCPVFAHESIRHFR